MKTQSTLTALLLMLLSPAAFAAGEARVAFELLLVVATIAGMLVITWRRRYMVLAKRRRRSGKNKRV